MRERFCPHGKFCVDECAICSGHKYKPTKKSLDKALLIVRGFDDETAEFIARAINSHEELLGAAKKAILVIKSLWADGEKPGWIAVELLSQAIAKAEAQP